MKKRQFLAALLAVACSASMAVPAFAADDEITMPEQSTVEDVSDAEQLGNWTMDVETSVQPASLKVTLPTSTTVLVNPYRMEVKIDATNTSYDTVLSPEMTIVNSSACAIKVGVKGTLATYQIVDTSDTTKWHAVNSADNNVTAAADVEVSGTLSLTKEDGTTITVASAADVVTNGNTYAVTDSGVSYAVSAKYTKPTYATKADDTKGIAVGDCTKKGTLVLSGMAASTNIKVATAKLKDPDAEKTNSLYMYVEGSMTSNTYAAFDKAANAGVKDKTGVMSTVGQVVLGTKETTGTVLYLNGGATGYARVSGQAATAPTTPWSTLKDKFNTSLTFVIDAVANPEPAAPTVTDVTLTPSAGAITSYTFNAATKEYTIEWTGASRNDGLTFAAVGADPADATVTYTAEGTGIAANDLAFTTDELSVKANPVPAAGVKADVTVTLTSRGKTTTYVYHVTVKP